MEDELIKIWQSSPEVERIKFEKSRLMLDMDSSLKRIHRFTKYDILIGQIAAITVFLVFLLYIYFVPPVLAKIASFFIAILAVWHLTKLRKLKKGKPKETAANYLEYLKQNRHYLKTLIKITKTLVSGYALISMPGYFLFITGFYLDQIVDGSLFIKMVLIGAVGHIAAFIYTLYILKKIYRPRLQKIDELIKVMEE